MNGWHSLILFGASAFALLWFKKKAEIQEVLPMLILLGGFLFHMVMGGKGKIRLFLFCPAPSGIGSRNSGGCGDGKKAFGKTEENK